MRARLLVNAYFLALADRLAGLESAKPATSWRADSPAR
jgi:hypothetical protein